MHQHCQTYRRVRDNHRENYEEHNDLVPFEFKLCQTVTDNTSDKGLNQSTNDGYKKRMPYSLEVVVLGDDILIRIKRKVFGNKRYGRVKNIVSGHERTCDS